MCIWGFLKSMHELHYIYPTVPSTISPTGVIAFPAYLSKDSDGPLSYHHILKFDTVPLNGGNGYDVFDGMFIVPTPETYVLT